MPPDSLLRRVRWGNVARLLALPAAVALVVLWPRLSAPAPRLPQAAPAPVAPAPVAAGDQAATEAVPDSDAHARAGAQARATGRDARPGERTASARTAKRPRGRAARSRRRERARTARTRRHPRSRKAASPRAHRTPAPARRRPAPPPPAPAPPVVTRPAPPRPAPPPPDPLSTEFGAP